MPRASSCSARVPRAFGCRSAALCLCGSILFSVHKAYAEVAWQTDYDAARRLAQRTGRPMLVDFSAPWCGPCRDMERTTFRDPAVQRLLARCICVRVDIDRDPGHARQFAVRSIPRILLFDARNRRTLDALGYRDPGPFRADLASALRGKPVIEASDDQTTGESPGIASLQAHLNKRDYMLWKAHNPGAAARARAEVVEQLGAFDADPRNRASALIVQLGEDGVAALVEALGHPRLAVRVAAYDGLSRLLSDQYHVQPAALPRYDAWAPAPERARMARAWSRWWSARRSIGSAHRL